MHAAPHLTKPSPDSGVHMLAFVAPGPRVVVLTGHRAHGGRGAVALGACE